MTDTDRPFPDDVPTASFHDSRLRMEYWFPKLAETDVPVPATEQLTFDKSGDGAPDFEPEQIAQYCKSMTDDGEYFVRTSYKHAAIDPGAGSHIRSLDTSEIENTMAELLMQQVMMEMPLGDHFWLREWLDLNWSGYTRETCHPELRVFIEDGDVLCHHPRLEGFDHVPDNFREEAVQLCDMGWENGVEDHAKTVADVFDGTWSVDFVCTRDLEWYCTDMALRALTDRGDYWHGLSEHPDTESGEMCEHDLERHLPDDYLPTEDGGDDDGVDFEDFLEELPDDQI